MNHLPSSQRPPTGALVSAEEAAVLLRSGNAYSVAADEALLRKLPRGRWIGGSIPYFMGQDGGITTRERVFVTPLSMFRGHLPTLRTYDADALRGVCVEAPGNGWSLIVMPAFTTVHSRFAREAPLYEDMYLKPLLGWVAGLHLDDLGQRVPVVVNGMTGELETERAVVMHMPLPDDQVARLDIVNLFRPGQGDRVRFSETGFHVQDCLINGRPTAFADYLQRHKIDTRLPLVADYSGAMINVAIKSVDAAQHRVDFYAPVFDDTEYRFAAPVGDYERALAAAMPHEDGTGLAWSCNCVLNYLYCGLEGKRTGPITGPMTFGEVAYQLLNQTLVTLHIDAH